MVAQLISLRWALFVNGLRRNKWQLVGVIVGALYIGGFLLLALFGLNALGHANPQLAAAIAVIASSLLVLGWFVIPVFFTGMDGSMDPQRFALFPIPSGTLAVGLLLAGFIGVPGIATLFFLLSTSLAYVTVPGLLLLSLLCAVGTALVAQVLARWGTSVATMLSARRGVREVASILLFIPIFFIGPAIAQLARNAEEISRLLPAVAGWLRFTPLGAWAGVPASLEKHDVVGAVIGLLVALATLGLGWWLYARTLQRAIVTPPHVTASASSKGLGWIGRFPATPTGAVAGRSLTYWLKDPRYAASIAVIPMLVILYVFVIPSLGSDIPEMAFILGPLVGALMGFSISADISYDSTAFALHVLTGVRGVADRTGRVIALFCVGVPLVLIAAIVPVAVSDQWSLLPAVLGASLGALMTSGGLASIASARWTYAVPLPGESPFKTPQGAGMRMMITQLALFFAIIITCLPTLALYLAAIVTGNPAFGWGALACGLGMGAGMLWLGIWLGGRWFEAREPELMQAVVLNR